MTQPRPKRRPNERGATLPEYALLLAGIVTAAILLLQFLSTKSGDEVGNQADCLESRPPPASCQIRAVTTTTTVSPSTVTSTTVPPSTSSTTSTTIVQSSAAWATGSWEYTTSPYWRADGPITITADGQPVADALVTVKVTILEPASGVTQFVTCTTDAAGQCTLSYDVPYTDVTAVRFSIERVESDPEFNGNSPGFLDFDTTP